MPLTSLRSVPAWFESNRWCAKCNLFGDSPCATAYMAFNIHVDRLRDPAGKWFASPSDADSLDTYLVTRIDDCLRAHPEILSRSRIERAEARAAAAKGPTVRRHQSTAELLSELNRRLKTLAAAAATVRQGPFQGVRTLPPRL